MSNVQCHCRCSKAPEARKPLDGRRSPAEPGWLSKFPKKVQLPFWWKGRFEVDLSQWVKSKRGAIARKGNLANRLRLTKSTKSVLYKWNHDATRTDVPIKQVSTIYAESIQTKTWWGQWQTCRSCFFKCSPSCVDSPLKLKTIEGISPLCSKYKSNLEAWIWRQLEY